MFNINNLNLDLKKVLEVGENYFPDIKKIKKEKERERIRKWAQGLKLKKIYKNKLKETKEIKIKTKKAIPPEVKMAYALYKSIIQTLTRSNASHEEYVVSTMVPMYKVPNAEILKTEKEAKEKTVTPIQEGVTLTLVDEDDINFVGIPVDNEKKDHQKKFEKVIEKKVEEEKVKKQQIENPFLDNLDNESILGDFDLPLKDKNSKEKAIKFAEKLFAS